MAYRHLFCLRILALMVFSVSLVVVACAVVDSGAMFAVYSAPQKQRSSVVSEESKAANAIFWETLHSGRYDDIPKVLDALTAVYLQNPEDAETAAHIGFTHMWRIGERARNENVSPTITDDLVIAHKYFSEAVRMIPDDARLKGFLASAVLGEAQIHGDEKLTRRGYFDLMDAKKAFPEFNLFTAGYVLSDLPCTDSKFHDAVEYQWQTLDLLAEEPFDRKTVSMAKYLYKETKVGPKRVLWNSWIAPHNWEGFFLNMGDMIVKQGDVATARSIYGNARLSKTYSSWPYREVLEARIAQAEENVARFRSPLNRRTNSRDHVSDFVFLYGLPSELRMARRQSTPP